MTAEFKEMHISAFSLFYFRHLQLFKSIRFQSLTLLLIILKNCREISCAAVLKSKNGLCVYVCGCALIHCYQILCEEVPLN